MTGDDFLQLAGELFARSRTPSEALCRTAISRAYYGVFHLTGDYFDKLGCPSSGHGVGPQWLKASGEPVAMRAAELLSELYSARRSADYELSHPKAIARFCNLNYVRDLIEQANELKSLLASCDKEPVRAVVKTGIEAWREKSGQPNLR